MASVDRVAWNGSDSNMDNVEWKKIIHLALRQFVRAYLISLPPSYEILKTKSERFQIHYE